MTGDLAAAANRNLRAAYRGPAAFLEEGETRQFGSITAAATGLPISHFDRLAVLEEPAPEDLQAAIRWLAERQSAYRVTVADPVLPAVESLLADHDLVETGREPGMAMGPLPEPPSAPAHVAIERVTDRAGLEAFVEVAAAVFGFPLDVARDLLAPGVVEESGMAYLVGRVGGDPVACGQLVGTGDVAGVYSIGVREGHRREGVGEAVSWAVLEAGRDAGCEVGVLQASDMGRSLYERMGFEPVVTYHYYAPADAD